MAVPQAIAPVRQLHDLHRSEERVSLGLDRLGQQPAGAASQNGRERVVDRIGLTEGNNGAIAHRGVSLLREVQAGFHPPRYASLNPPSPRFAYSSRRRFARSVRRVLAVRCLQRAGARGERGQPPLLLATEPKPRTQVRDQSVGAFQLVSRTAYSSSQQKQARTRDEHLNGKATCKLASKQSGKLGLNSC